MPELQPCKTIIRIGLIGKLLSAAKQKTSTLTHHSETLFSCSHEYSSTKRKRTKSFYNVRTLNCIQVEKQACVSKISLQNACIVIAIQTSESDVTLAKDLKNKMFTYQEPWLRYSYCSIYIQTRFWKTSIR